MHDPRHRSAPPARAPLEAPPGLRLRKKTSVRRTISDVATRLFVEHGYDRVTMAQIAAAADVSVKTIFNHFGSKEELFLDREGELEGAILMAIRTRPAGTGIAEALRALAADNRIPVPGEGWASLADPDLRQRFERFLATWHDTPALRGRSLLGGLRLADRLRDAIAAETGRPASDPAVGTFAGLLVAALQLRGEALASAVFAGLPAAQVERRVRAVADDVFPRIERACADLEALAAARRGA